MLALRFSLSDTLWTIAACTPFGIVLKDLAAGIVNAHQCIQFERIVQDFVIIGEHRGLESALRGS